MEVDSDVDGTLLQQFSSMGTTDKEVLITQFQQLLGNQLSDAGCAFFLDMNNWNLQAAIGSYYDYEQPGIKLPSMILIRDTTVGEGESAPPNTVFRKTWKIQNSGEETWPPGCCLKFIKGEQFTHQDRIMVEPLEPKQVIDVGLNMISPDKTGIFVGQWRMCTATGLFFGEMIWVILQVEESGLLGVTQQMSQFGSEITPEPPQSASCNPFASPSKLHCDLPMVSSPAQWASPNHSMIAQHGSAPNSPLSSCDSPVVSSALLTSTPPQNAQMALFQTPESRPEETESSVGQHSTDSNSDMS